MVAKSSWHRALSFPLATVLIKNANSPRASAPTFTSVTGRRENRIQFKKLARSNWGQTNVTQFFDRMETDEHPVCPRPFRCESVPQLRFRRPVFRMKTIALSQQEPERQFLQERIRQLDGESQRF